MHFKLFLRVRGTELVGRWKNFVKPVYNVRWPRACRLLRSERCSEVTCEWRRWISYRSMNSPLRAISATGTGSPRVLHVVARSCLVPMSARHEIDTEHLGRRISCPSLLAIEGTYGVRVGLIRVELLKAPHGVREIRPACHGLPVCR